MCGIEAEVVVGFAMDSQVAQHGHRQRLAADRARAMHDGRRVDLLKLCSEHVARLIGVPRADVQAQTGAIDAPVRAINHHRHHTRLR